jgi:thymidylate synthase (FAD)
MEINMKIVREPKVYLISKPMLEDNEFENFICDIDARTYMPDMVSNAELIPEIAGKLCYMSFANPKGRKNKEYLEHIKEVGHGSVTEHSNFGLIITGISRAVSHELVRHRAGASYSQLSQRYVDESVAEYVLPHSIEEGTPEYDIWLDGVMHSHNAYCKLVDALMLKFSDVADKTHRRKLAREAARSVLPNATETKIFVTMNTRAFRHLFEMRASVHADREINRMAIEIWKKLVKVAPNLFSDYELINDELITKYRKV